MTPAAVASVTVNPASATLVLGITPTQQLTALTKDANGNTLTGRVVTWSSNNTAAATVDANGLVTAVAAGSATITATSEGKTGTSSITVSDAAVATVSVSLSQSSISAIGTSQATAILKDANGNVLTGRTVTWSSDNSAVATVSQTGVVTALTAGNANIIATSEGRTGAATITVTPAPVATVTVTPSSAMLVLGVTPTQQLSAATKDANGNTLTGRLVTWSSDNSGVATVDGNGLVTAVAAGSAIVTATSEGKTATSSITVSLDPVATVAVTLTPSSITAVGSSQAAATLRDGTGNVLSGRVVTWSSDNTAVATVNAQGVITAVATGTANIIGTSEGKNGSAPLTVTPAPVASVTVSPSAKTLVLGIDPTQQLTAVTKDVNGVTLTGRVVTWSSNNTAAATVDANGLVTAVAAGSATITATSESKTGTSSITVNTAPVASVTVSTPTTPMLVGQTQSLTATTKDANGNTLTGRTVTWVSSNTAALTVSPSGATTTVTGVAPGSASVTATSEGVSSAPTATITVNPVPVATVTVSPASATLVLGITPTQQLTAVTKDGNGNTLTGRTVTWSSNNTAAATVDANGLVTAVAAGSATITATSEGKTGTSTITVSQAPVTTVSVALAPSSITAVQTSQATATLRDANGSVLTGRTITWSSDNTAVATVNAQGLVTAVATGSANIIATSEGKTGSASLTVTPAAVTTVTVTPASATLVLGITPTQQLTAVTKDGNGNTLTGRVVTWSSNNTAAATVDANGLVTAVAAGSATITATSEGKTGTSSITVSVAPVATVTVSLAAGSITAIGTTQATATLRDANANILTGRMVTWSSDNTAAATVDANGLVTAVATGTANIIATGEGKTGSATLTVTPAPVVTVTVSPPSATLVLGITPTQQISAVTKDANGNTLAGRVVTWSSNNTAAATVDANGLVTAVAAGSATITATSEGQTGTSSITVNVAPVATVSVTLTPSSITTIGASQATATLRDANGNVLTGRTITWSSDNTAVATVNAQGQITPVATGTANITATSETKTGSALLTVTPAPVATVTVSPSSATLVLGITPTQQLSAVTKDANGNTLTGRVVTWSSDNTAAATVDANGLVTAVAAGSATITATSEGHAGTSSITVSVAPVATVSVTLTSNSITTIGASQATATLRDANSNVLTGRTVTWSSDNIAVATVNAQGQITPVATGTVNIIATSEGKTGSAQLTVTPPPVATVTVTPASATLVLGITPTQQLSAVTKDANGNTLTGRTVTWTSDNAAAATVDATGLVTAVAAGSATITATSEGKTGTSTITVNIAPVATVTVALTPNSITAIQTSQATATLRDANGNVLTGRSVTWSSDNTAAATVDAQGVVTAVATGSANITATSEGKSGSAGLTVTPAPVATVTVTPPSATLVLGITATQQLSAVTKDANGNTLTGRVVTWSSDNTAAATVDVNGLVTAVAAGSATITATSEGKTGTSSITVNVAPVATVTVSLASSSITAIGTTQATATLRDANANILTGRTVTWSSDNTAAATVDANGAVTAVAAGTANIIATSETKTGSAELTVTPAPVATVTVTPTSATVFVAWTQQLAAETKDANGNTLTGRAVTWQSDHPEFATVSPSGLVTGVAAGSATITATSEGQNGTSAITVTVAPVATVAVTLTPSTITAVGTSHAAATLHDANGNVLTGRVVTWSSDNTAIATVDAQGVVTAVAEGTAHVTATSEGKSNNALLTVDPAPVASVAVSPPAASIVVPNTQQLTVTLRDAHNNVLTGRTITWSSDNTAVATVSASGLVTAVAAGGATITATSESVNGTSSITVTSPATTASLLHVSGTNGRYFENASGQAVYLTGSHTWSNLQDNGTVDPPTAFDYTAYLDFLESHHHNFFRMWAWEQAKWTAEIESDYWIAPGPYLRTGPGTALDGKPKFDLNQFDPAYFDRLRARVQAAGARGIYVSVMLFDGWSVATKGGEALNNPWKGHPFNAANNINGIDGDTNADGLGLEVQTLGNSAVTDLQDAYVRHVIDAVGDLDNVLYEIDNEGDATSKDWQYHMIQLIRSYEATKPKQHPIGMTPMWPGGVDSDLFASDADWIANTDGMESPKTATGSKVLISDTDHICGICGSTSWVWKNFVKGQNPILMDGYDGAAIGLGAEGYNASDPKWEAIRNNMGYARDYALRMDLSAAIPHGDKVSRYNDSFAETGYCLAKLGAQYLVYLPGGGNVTLDLTEVTGTLSVEWLNPATGIATQAGTTGGGPSVTLTAPFSGPAVLFLH
ncbi:MAG TPA: Ig-like domain-containing protein [Gemmatimonadaceae bacterium]|nr:Ig-like domain-containing protein [Gemmatimonadaceae bacterium]